MAINSYTTLQTAIASQLKRSNLTNIADFITLCEENISNGNGSIKDAPYYHDPLRVAEMIDNRILTLESGDNTTTLPTGYLEMRGAPYISNYAPLEYRSPTEIGGITNTGIPGRPQYYSDIGNIIYFNKFADADYNININFYKLLNLSDSNLTNNVLTNYPSIYLYGSLFHAASYIKNDGDMQKYFTLFKAAVHGANSRAIAGRYKGISLIVRSDTPTP